MDVTTVKVPYLMEDIPVEIGVPTLFEIYRYIRMIQMLEEIHTDKCMKMGLL